MLESGTLDLPQPRGRRQIAARRRGCSASSGVDGVFFGSDFITVSKADGEWPQLKPAILGAIMEHFMSGAPLARARAKSAAADDEFFEEADAESGHHHQGPDRDAGAARGRQ